TPHVGTGPLKPAMINVQEGQPNGEPRKRTAGASLGRRHFEPPSALFFRNGSSSAAKRRAPVMLSGLSEPGDATGFVFADKPHCQTTSLARLTSTRRGVAASTISVLPLGNRWFSPRNGT